MQQIFDFLNDISAQKLFYHVLYIFVITFVISAVVYFLIDRFYEKTKDSKKFWNKTLFKSIKLPIVSLIAITGLINIIDTFDNNLGLNLLNDFTVLKKLLTIITTSWFIFNIIESTEENYLLKNKKTSKLDISTIDSLTKLSRVITVVLVCLLSMQTLGFSISALVAFAGGGGVVAGFAAKDLLSNFFGAISIYLDKPFVVGDWIRSPDKDIEGIVEHVGLRVTKIRNLNKRPLYIQNAIFNSLSIENVSKMTHRKFEGRIVFTYKNVPSITKISQSLEKMLGNNEEVCKDLNSIVSIETFDSDSASIIIMTYTKNINFESYCKFKERLLLEIHSIITKHNGDFIKLEPAPKALGSL